MRILSRYFAVRFLKYFAATLLASLMAVVVVEFLLNFDDMLAADKAGSSILTYLLLRVPSYYLRDLIPVSTFAAAFLTFGTAARWFESTAAKAGGLSLHSLIVPTLVAAAGIAGISFALNETLVIGTSRGWSRLEHGADTVLDFREGAFWYYSGNTIYRVEEADSTARTLRGVKIYHRDERGRLVSSVRAPRVFIQDTRHWILEDAVVYTFAPGSADGGVKVEHHPALRRAIIDEGEAALMSADAGGLSLSMIQEYIAARPSAERVRRLTHNLHQRLTGPLFPLLFTVLAIPLGLRVERTRSIARPAVYAIVVLASFYLLRSVMSALAHEGLLHAAVAPWLLLGSFTSLAAWQLVTIPR